MPVFVILNPHAPAVNAPLEAAIESTFTKNNLRITEGQWLVASEGTAKDVSDKLGLTQGGLGSAIIVTVGGYYGRASTPIWEWIAAKMSEGASGAR